MSALASVEIERGGLDAAKTLLDQALKLAEDMAARESEAYANGLLGQIAEKRGDKIAATNHYREAEFIYRQNGQYTLAAPFGEMMKKLGATPHPKGRRTSRYFRQTESGSNAPPSAAARSRSICFITLFSVGWGVSE